MGDQSKDIILSIRGMSKSFGRNRVLDHINLDVRKGTVMVLMGENGAGKDEGTIYLDGKEVNFSGPKDALENGIAMVHQELNQCLERNVVDNLFLGRYPVNALGMIDEGRMKNEASELFRKLGMIAEKTGIAEKGFRVVINTGDEGGQTVKHLHIHVIGGKALGWPPC